ncbi:MAG: cytochrome c biogenesis protein CcdA [Chloroflexi bacterium]|nr:cytochrome c biogenesis protein CcdA [Chloroflexota bacterium]
METQSAILFIAFGAGVLSFVSPCCLPLVPVYLAHLAGASASEGVAFPSQRVTFFHALGFVLGFSALFVALGASAGLLGSVLAPYMSVLRKVAGLLLVVLGLHIIGVFRIPFLYYERRLSYSGGTRPSYWRSFLIGGAFAAGWTPCVGPILAGIFTLAWDSQTAAQGALLLAVYSAGLGTPFLLAGLGVGRLAGVLHRVNRYLRPMEVASGALLVAVGVLVFFNALVFLNQYFDFFGLGKGI